MEGPKYCSWDVKELANDYGWTELPIHPQDEDIMMSFYSDRHGGVRANVFLTTGTVATSLDHPTKGKTLLYRGKRNTFDQLEEVFDNPRVLTGSGYKTRAKLREEENEIENDQVYGPSGYGEDYEGTTDHYDLYDGLDDIEKLRIEDSDDNGMIDDDLYLKRLEFESVSEFDGESQIEKLLSKWDEEESETEDEEESEEHLYNNEVTSSNEDSENEDCTESTETDENESDNSHHSSSGDSGSDDYSDSEGLGTDSTNESEYTSEDLENDIDLDGF